MKNSLTKKLLLAVITLGIAVIATVGSTYAWFSMNTKVEATGMQLTATTPVNVVISKTSATDGFGSAVEFTTPVLNMYPASTSKSLLKSDGTFDFFAVREGQVIGSNGEGGKAATGSQGTLFQEDLVLDKNYSGEDAYFLKETIWLKTTAGKVSLRLEEIMLSDVTEAVDSTGTVVSSATTTSGTFEIKNAIYVALLTANDTFIYCVDGTTGEFTGIGAVNSDGTFEYGDTYELSTASSSGTQIFNETNPGFVKLGTTAQEVTILVWLEGEDPECVNGIGGQGINIGLRFGYVNGSFEAEE